MLNLVGSNDIEMLFGAEKPYIAGGHGGTDYTPFLASIPEMALTPLFETPGHGLQTGRGCLQKQPRLSLRAEIACFS